MKSVSLLSCLVPLAALLLTSGSTRAELIEYSYSWSVSPSPPVYPSGTGTVALSVAADGSASSLLGGAATLIPGATVVTSSSAGGNVPPDQFDVAYSMTLHLTDTGSGQSANLTFSGTLEGNLTATTSTLTSTFNNPVTQQATLGGHLYSVTIDPVMTNIPATSPAEISARVQVGGTTEPTPPRQAPEPSALLLTGLALPLLAAAWRRRQARDVEN